MTDCPSQCQRQRLQLVLVNVEVPEEVKGRPQSPAGLHIVHLLGQLRKKT